MQPIMAVGGDARTHMIVRSLLAEGRSVTCSPGNPGIFFEPGVLVGDVKPTDHAGLITLARSSNALTIVGNEGPLVAGIGDDFLGGKLPFIGPSGVAAQIEGSKKWCCQLLAEARVPIPKFEVFDDSEAAIAYLERAVYPLVIKADGLCAGKGVRIVQNFDEAKQAVHDFMVERVFDEAGVTIVIQEFLVGRELDLRVSYYLFDTVVLKG